MAILFLVVLSAILIFQSYCKDELITGFAKLTALKHNKVMALTFDDGPHRILTAKLLDTFKQFNAKGTFFVMGCKVKLHPYLLQRMVNEGHEVGNHGWNHPVLPRLSFDDVQKQLRATSSAIYEATNRTTTIMRPPYGKTYKKLNMFMSEKEKLTVVLWSYDTLDWRRPSVSELSANIMNGPKSGDIVLCHDVHPGTIEAIHYSLGNMTKDGWKFVTVTELAKLSTLAMSAT